MSTPKRLTRAESQARTRRKLLDAAARVFRRRGFEGASVEQVAAEAGFTRGAFYSNFESKEQIFVELLQERIYADYRTLLEQVPRDASPVEQLRWSVRKLMERYRRGRRAGAWELELWLEVLAGAVRNRKLRSLASSFWSGTRSMLELQVEEGYRRAGESPPIEPRQLAIALTALDIGLALQHLVDPAEVPLELYPELYEALFRPLLPGERGVSSRGSPAAAR
jgi:AcrR family transcriptional regulator